MPGVAVCMCDEENVVPEFGTLINSQQLAVQLAVQSMRETVSQPFTAEGRRCYQLEGRGHHNFRAVVQHTNTTHPCSRQLPTSCSAWRLRVDSSSLMPPDRKWIPGTAGGMERAMVRTVYCGSRFARLPGVGGCLLRVVVGCGCWLGMERGMLRMMYCTNRFARAQLRGGEKKCGWSSDVVPHPRSSETEALMVNLGG